MPNIDTSTVAPMPNRDLEAPHQTQDERGHLAPGVISREMPVVRMNCEQVHAGDMAAMEEYAVLAGPVPAAG